MTLVTEDIGFPNCEDVDGRDKHSLARLASMVDGVDPQTFDRIPTNLEVVGEQLGVQAVLRRELDVSAFLYPMEDNRLVVFLNSTDVPGRQRFSWAHELGHIVMAEESVPLLPCGTGRMRDKELERSCDVIAAELLMPRRLFAEAADMEGWTLKAVPGWRGYFKSQCKQPQCVCVNSAKGL